MTEAKRKEYIERLADFRAENIMEDLNEAFMFVKEQYIKDYSGLTDAELKAMFDEYLVDID